MKRLAPFVALALGTASGAPLQWQPVELEVMRLVNAARTGGYDCATKKRDPRAVVPALVPHPKLLLAARAHAADMQRRGYFAHESSDGRGVKDRVRAAKYTAVRVGENILGGQRLGSSAKNTVNWWLNSAVHCRNVMNLAYTQIAAGHVFVKDDPAGIQHYWVLVFATPVQR
jgi:uncharacterized protein YkwD